MKIANKNKKPSPVNEETSFFGSQSDHSFFTPAIQRSPLSDDVKTSWTTNANKGNIFDILRAKSPANDPDLQQYIASIFPAETDDFWLADTIMKYGPEPLWPYPAMVERNKRSLDHKWAPEAGNIGAGMGKDKKVQAFYFPGTSNRRALIVGGVHGKEKAGVEVVYKLLEMMRGPNAKMPYFTVIIVPELFPDNVRDNKRSTYEDHDPNRQFPEVGKDAAAGKDKSCKVDTNNFCIEEGNLILMDLIDRFQPERVASVHGHRQVSEKELKKQGGAGITTDPRPGKEQEDDALALAMAKKAHDLKVNVPFNKIGTGKEMVRYPTDDANHQPGVTFGQWGSHATPTHPAMNIILIETDGYKFSKKDSKKQLEIESLASVLRDIFLTEEAPKKTK